MQARLQQFKAARATLAEALSLLTPRAPVADPARNRARAFMATTLMWGDKAGSAGGCWRRRPAGLQHRQRRLRLGARLGPLCAGLDRQPPGPEQRNPCPSPADAGRGESLERPAHAHQCAGGTRLDGAQHRPIRGGALPCARGLRWLKTRSCALLDRHRLSMLGAALTQTWAATPRRRPRRALDQPSLAPTERTLCCASRRRPRTMPAGRRPPWPGRAGAGATAGRCDRHRAGVHPPGAGLQPRRLANTPRRQALRQAQAGLQAAEIPPKSRFSCACAVCKANCCCAPRRRRCRPAPDASADGRGSGVSLPPLERTRALGWLGCSLSLLGHAPRRTAAARGA